MADQKQLSISIEYCSMWGYLSQAVGLAEAILDEFSWDVSQLTLIPSRGGVFEVMVDGHLVFSKKQLGRHPTIEEIKGVLRKKMAGVRQ